MRPSNAATLSLISFAERSSACSRCFFLTRKRADAAVFRRRLSSSAARREASSRSAGGVESAFRFVPADGAPRVELGEPAVEDVG